MIYALGQRGCILRDVVEEAETKWESQLRPNTSSLGILLSLQTIPPTAAMLTRLFLLALAASSAVLGSPTQQVIGNEAELSLSEKWSYSDCGKRILLLVDEEPGLIRPSRNRDRHHPTPLSGGFPRPSKAWPKSYGHCFWHSA